jgi:hypothetical protein
MFQNTIHSGNEIAPGSAPLRRRWLARGRGLTYTRANQKEHFMSAYSSEKPGRGRVYDSIIDTIGNTPIVRLSKLANADGVKAKSLPSSSSSTRSPRSRTASASP